MYPDFEVGCKIVGFACTFCCPALFGLPSSHCHILEVPGSSRPKLSPGSSGLQALHFLWFSLCIAMYPDFEVGCKIVGFAGSFCGPALFVTLLQKMLLRRTGAGGCGDL